MGEGCFESLSKTVWEGSGFRVLDDGCWKLDDGVKVLDDRGCFESLSMTVDDRWKESRKKEKESSG